MERGAALGRRREEQPVIEHRVDNAAATLSFSDIREFGISRYGNSAREEDMV
ncbi:UNVERIFIED_CONTAM: hypothetical protein Sradi_5592500 [Sesamum radiatum]|uniref:Uncharacterized protein n=1 Tax=Sesamum radiatum TaxID=300843 RepID=A0AAW2L0P9_SESRA